MLETGESRHFMEWIAFHRIRASEEKVEATASDSPLELQAKARRQAQAMNRERTARRRGR